MHTVLLAHGVVGAFIVWLHLRSGKLMQHGFRESVSTLLWSKEELVVYFWRARGMKLVGLCILFVVYGYFACFLLATEALVRTLLWRW